MGAVRVMRFGILAAGCDPEKMAAILFICSLFFLSALGSQPTPCSSPDLLEGQKTLFYESTIEAWEKFSYDAVQKRIFAFKTKWFPNGTKLETMEFLLFQESIRYQFYPQSRTCVKSDLHTPFQPIAIPSNATFLVQMYVGGTSGPQEGLLVNVWSVETGHGDPYILTFTAFGCLPMSINYHCKEKGWIVETASSMTTGISDPNVFVPPAECSELN
ncbi:mammalian ependymin-related protein 1-like [Stegostoma tigrinum]|uniref:mammalian ependymin-related protein 1-like n=1 Tax=Stegostoma tigrinum TaxID=3053191 RepID=UPI00286FB350|nr:mammalian ependymin-related protein 1-like [Stegostoma tigrinum]